MPDLSQFTGTENYYKASTFSNLSMTDGIRYLSESVGCYWLIDIIASVQNKPKVKANKSFIIWTINVKDNQAAVRGYQDVEEDGTYSYSKCVYTQMIQYTDFPEGKYEFYQCNDLLLLKGEY